MPDEPSAAFFAWLDQTPQRRRGGRIISVREVAESRSQLREGLPQPVGPSRFPQLERRRRRLALMAYQLEKEERE
jgi:hypothetical protein